MYKVPAVERIAEFDFRGVPLYAADQQLTLEGYEGSEILAALCVFNIQTHTTQQHRLHQAKQFFDKNPVKAQNIADHLLQQFGQENQYKIISHAAIKFMTSKSSSKHRRGLKRSLITSEKFILPYRTTLLVLALTISVVYYFELNALLIYILPISHVAIFNVWFWLMGKRSGSKSKQKILYLA